MLNVQELPYVTAALPGIGGRIKADPQDFEVEEIPLYEASGEGTHVYFQIEKRQLTTMHAVQQIARALGIPSRDVGYAGLKDAAAVTRQMLSIEHIDPKRVESLSVPGVRVLSISRHKNKLKLGHLAGNRFRIKLRWPQQEAKRRRLPEDQDESKRADGNETSRPENLPTGSPSPQLGPSSSHPAPHVDRLNAGRSVLAELVRRGAPNYFGRQRFGARGDTWMIGRAILKGDYPEALALMLGRPGPADHGPVRRARELFDHQQYEEAARSWPYPFNHERRVCIAIAKSGGDFNRGFRAVDIQMRRFFVSAYQSQLFNQVVARRIDGLDQLMLGDLAWKHDSGAVFRVMDLNVEQPRCHAFEISPTGPLFGRRMTEPEHQPAEMEQAVLAEENLKPDDFSSGPYRATGGRRSLRFQPRDAALDASSDESGDFIEASFSLDPGCYATVVLREITKADETGPHDSPQTQAL